MDQFSVGLSDDELQRRIDENPNEPWRPDFIAAIGHKRNDYWVKKIIDQVLKDQKVSCSDVEDL